MKIYKSSFLSIIYLEDSVRLEFVWSTNSANLDDAQFRHELIKQVEAIEKYKPQNILIDTRKFLFPIVPRTQTWADRNVYPSCARNGVAKIGLLMSPEMIAQLSIEQAMEDNSQDEEFVFKFFEDKETLLKWFEDTV